jgi:hypothetical protein
VPIAGWLGTAGKFVRRGIGFAAEHADEAADLGRYVETAAHARGPNRVYSARELIRRAEEPGPFHNFPESFNEDIFERGTPIVVPDFFNKAKPGLSNGSIQYRLPGTINDIEGVYEIFTRPSTSGNSEVIMHRFFRPNQ